VIALAAFGISLYISGAGVADANSNQAIVLPLSLVGPMFLLIAGVLVFLRLFQRLLHLLARRAARRPGAPPVLAPANCQRRVAAGWRRLQRGTAHLSQRHTNRGAVGTVLSADFRRR
jgi:hypothetical protein